MSAWVVSNDQMDLLVSAAFDLKGRFDQDGRIEVHHKGDTHVFYDSEGTKLGLVLLTENVRSVNYRYDSNDGVPPYVFREVHGLGREVPVGQVLQTINCFEYQACERPDWKDSLAYAICHTIRQRVCSWIADRDGAVWVWSRDKEV